MLGLLIFLIAFLGCCGALIESHCILLTFGIIVTVILTLELALAGLAFAFKSDLRTGASRELRDIITHYNWTGDGTDRYSLIIDQMQMTMHCCGVNSTADWSDLNPFPGDSGRLPDSCCPRPSNRSNGPTLRETLPATLFSPASSSDSDSNSVLRQRNSGSCRAPSGPDGLMNQPPTSGSMSAPSSNIVSQAPPFSVDSGFLVGGDSSSGSGSTAASQKVAAVPFTGNCADIFVDGILGLVGPLGLLCLAVALFQLLGIVFAFSLSKAVRREYQVV